MFRITNAVPVTEQQPTTIPIPAETIPDNPNAPFGVQQQIIDDIDDIGRKYAEPRE